MSSNQDQKRVKIAQEADSTYEQRVTLFSTKNETGNSNITSFHLFIL